MTLTNSHIYRWIAAFYLLIMCTQYLPLEGIDVSPVKVTAMCLAPIILLLSFSRITTALVCGAAYLGWCLISSYLRFASPRIDTIGYMVMFWVCYMMFYNLIYSHVFSADFFIKLMRSLLYAYIILLAVQQLVSLLGISTLPIINLGPHDNIMKCQSLSLEPSHSARIMGAAFYAFLRTSELKTGAPVSLESLLSEHKWLFIGFLYAMLSMQSGTAMFVLLVLTLYFFKWRYIVPFTVAIFLFPLFQEFIQNDQIDRVAAILSATLTGDAEAVVMADHSASYRVLPILNIFYLDFQNFYTWFGYGVDTAREIYFATFDPRKMVAGSILDYGLISYLLSLLFVFTCCIRPFISLPALMFFCGIGGGTGNVAYGWGILMIFTCVSYFYLQSNKNLPEQPRCQYSAFEEKGFHTHVNF